MQTYEVVLVALLPVHTHSARTTGRVVAARFAAACLFGLSGVAACGAAMHDETASALASSPTDGAEELRGGHRLGNKDAGVAQDPAPDASEAGDAAPRCPHGVLEDPHRGYVRCLAPGEADAGWLPPAPQPIPDDGGADGGASDAAPEPSPAEPRPHVEWSAPVYENGEVPRIEKALKSAANDIANCVAAHGGLTGKSGSLKVQFMVRARGRAEGVEVLAAKGVGSEVAVCVRLAVKNKPVGAPTAEPVGVTVSFSLTPAE